ncbi:MAG: DUF4124 domain-containing protein [Desulfobacteraceae bacterium]|nr:MAG: DUF4124 domain-containing protein [Desulfobacteraceae bacterium]
MKISRFISILFLASFLCLLSFGISFSEYYQYIDENGVITFTDDLSEVPVDQLDQYKTHESVETSPVEEDAGGDDQSAAQTPANTVQKVPVNTASGTAALLEEARALERESKELENLYQGIQKDRKEIEAVTFDKLSNEEKTQYEERFNALSKRISDYDEQRQSFENKVDAYNQKVLGPPSDTPAVADAGTADSAADQQDAADQDSEALSEQDTVDSEPADEGEEEVVEEDVEDPYAFEEDTPDDDTDTEYLLEDEDTDDEFEEEESFEDEEPEEEE